MLVAEEMRRSGRSRSAVVEELAEEAAKMRLFPGIVFGDRPRRARLVGTGLDVWELIEMLGSYKDDEKELMEAHPLVTDRHIRVARAYAERFPEEIELQLEGNRRPLEELRALYPFILSASELR